MCEYRVDQHLIVLKLHSISINKIVVTEFIGDIRMTSEYIRVTYEWNTSDIPTDDLLFEIKVNFFKAFYKFSFKISDL